MLRTCRLHRSLHSRHRRLISTTSFLRAPLLYQSSYSARWAITQRVHLLCWPLHTIVSRGYILLGLYRVARLSGLWLMTVVVVVSVAFASDVHIRRGCGRAWVGTTFARGGRRWSRRHNETRGQSYHHHDQHGRS